MFSAPAEHLHAGVHHLLDGDHACSYSGYAHGLQGMIGALGSDPDPTSAQLSDELAEPYERSFQGATVEPAGPSAVRRPTTAHTGGATGPPEYCSVRQGASCEATGSRASEVDLLIDVVSNDCFDLNFSLCHGDLGNLLILERQPAHVRGSILSAVQLRVAQLSSDILPPRLAKPVGKTFQNDSLMIGLAGIGFGLIALSGAVTVRPAHLREDPAGSRPNPRRRKTASASP